MTCTKCLAASAPSRYGTAHHPIPRRIDATVTNTPKYRHIFQPRQTLEKAGTSPGCRYTPRPLHTAPSSHLSRLPHTHAPENTSYPFRSRIPDQGCMPQPAAFPRIHPVSDESPHSAYSLQRLQHFDRNIELSDFYYIFRSFVSIIAYFQVLCNLHKNLSSYTMLFHYQYLKSADITAA